MCRSGSCIMSGLRRASEEDFRGVEGFSLRVCVPLPPFLSSLCRRRAERRQREQQLSKRLTGWISLLISCYRACTPHYLRYMVALTHTHAPTYAHTPEADITGKTEMEGKATTTISSEDTEERRALDQLTILAILGCYFHACALSLPFWYRKDY